MITPRSIGARLAALEAGRPTYRDLAAEAEAFGEPAGRDSYVRYEPDGTPVTTFVAGRGLAYELVGIGPGDL